MRDLKNNNVFCIFVVIFYNTNHFKSFFFLTQLLITLKNAKLLPLSPPHYLEVLPDGTSFPMIFVEGGRFMMGSEDGLDDEKPVHEVQVADFYIGQFPVTQAVWYAVMKNTGNTDAPQFKSKNHPIEEVSWYDIQFFLKELNAIPYIAERNHREKIQYRLPSEAKWEFAAKGGKKSKGFLYAGNNKLKEVGWFDANSHQETKEIGVKNCNELGLFDMSGNVEEWCEDIWHDNYEGTPTNGSAWTEEGDNEIGVLRGGSWTMDANHCRSAARILNIKIGFNNSTGLRLTRY